MAGKKEGANIADLLVLTPRTNPDGKMHLDIIVTEAKFVTHDGLASAATTSSKQLLDALWQMTEAMDGETRTIDQTFGWHDYPISWFLKPLLQMGSHPLTPQHGDERFQLRLRHPLASLRSIHNVPY